MDDERTLSMYHVTWIVRLGEWEQEDTDNYFAYSEDHAVDQWVVDGNIPAGAQVVNVEKDERYTYE